MGETILRAVDIKRVFKTAGGDFMALKGVNVDVEAAKLTILKGRSGSGKTTLMNIMGQLDNPTSGQILFNGEDLTKRPSGGKDAFRRTNAGFVFQSVALVGMMSAFENVEFGLRIAGYDRKESALRAKRCLDLVGLGQRMQHMARELSGGEQQRVAIARAIAHKPSIIFADEPTAELDTSTGFAVMRVFKDLIDSEGVTVLMTTHDPGLMDIADKLYVMEDGIVTESQDTAGGKA